MATLILGIVNEYSYTAEKVIYFFIEWGPFEPQGMPNKVNCL